MVFEYEKCILHKFFLLVSKVNILKQVSLLLFKFSLTSLLQSDKLSEQNVKTNRK